MKTLNSCEMSQDIKKRDKSADDVVSLVVLGGHVMLA